MNSNETQTEKKKSLTPHLRFREFEGEWKHKDINELATKLNVGFVGTCEPFYTNSTEGVLLVRTGNLKGIKILLDDEKYVTKEFHDKNKKSQIFPGDLLLARHGGNGEICMVPKGFPPANTLNIVILRTNSELDSSYFQLTYTSYTVQKQISSVTAGSTQGVINTGAIGRLKITFPTLPEQQKIASFLSEIDKKIQQLTRKKELLEQYKKGVMQQVFSGKLPFKDENGKAYPKWEEKRLGNIATIVKGKGISKTDIVADGTLECIRYGELYTHYKERITKIFSHTNLDKSDLVLSNFNDVIIPSSGETQIDIARASCVLKSGVALGGDLNILISQQNGVFLSYYINHSLKYEIAKIAQGNSVVHLYPSQLEVLKVQLPNLDEQKKIAAFIGSIDDKVECIEIQIAKTQEFKKGLLQQLFV
jgi:type I restriction enzyme, S subunit